MRKGNSAIITIIVLIILVGGGYALLHKSNKPASSSTKTSTTSQSTAPAVNNAVLVTKTASNVGQYLADPSGKTLYTYSADSNGVSNCMGSCLANWPAYVDSGSTSNLPAGVGIIKRTDNGQTQYTYNGLPLYYFVSDPQGQVTGNGVQNFKVAKPAASSSANSSNSNSTNQSTSSSSGGYNY